jgi:hypothetical protein
MLLASWHEGLHMHAVAACVFAGAGRSCDGLHANSYFHACHKSAAGVIAPPPQLLPHQVTAQQRGGDDVFPAWLMEKAFRLCCCASLACHSLLVTAF